MPVMQERAIRAASSHDQADARAGDRALRLGTSGRGSMRQLRRYQGKFASVTQHHSDSDSFGVGWFQPSLYTTNRILPERIARTSVLQGPARGSVMKAIIEYDELAPDDRPQDDIHFDFA